MMRTIYNVSGRIIWTGEAETVKDALYAAIASGADLTEANLVRANLAGANLAGANLTGADLTEANLAGAKLSGANLAGANLAGANLTEANLTEASLTGANLCPVMVLLARIGAISPELCALLMRYDAANHPNGIAAFSAWASGGACPYDGVRVQRVANFREQRQHWNPDAPLLSAFELMKLVLREKCVNSDYHDKEH